MQISSIDWVILIAYFGFIAAVGLIVGLRVKDSDDYFLGKRRFGKLLMIGQSFGVGTTAEMPVSLAGAVYSIGASGIWYQWKNLFATPFFWLMAPVFRRLRRTTMAEATEDRYGPWMGGIYTLYAAGFFILSTASVLKGAAKVIDQATGGHVGVNRLVIGMTVIFIIYSFVGGLVAAAWTDLFQGFLIILLSFMLIPLGLRAVGGTEGMKQALDAYKFSLAAPQGIGLWFIAMLTLNGLVGIMAQPHMLAAVGTGKDEYTCRIGFFYGMFVKRVCTVGWAMVGLIVTTMVVQGRFGTSGLADPEEAFGFACHHLLFPGSLGLLIACVLAATMASCSALMVDSGALFSQGFYRKYLVVGRRDKHYLWVGRLSGLMIALAGVFYAFFLIKRVLYSFLLTETLATYMGISVLAGIMWKRANRWGAVSSLVVSLGTNFALYHLLGKRLDYWDPNVFLAALVAGVLALGVVSLLTPPESPEKVRLFFDNLHTSTELPVLEASALSLAPSVAGRNPGLPVSNREARGQQLILVNLLNLRPANLGRSFLRIYRTDLVGFAAGWALALGLVGATWLLFHTCFR